MSSRKVTEQQLAALIDANRSLNYGGLIEMPSRNPLDIVWTAMDPTYKKRHAESTVQQLVRTGLLQLSGEEPDRRAQITEPGLLELDIEGVCE
jgi:hypothetical protein